MLLQKRVEKRKLLNGLVIKIKLPINNKVRGVLVIIAGFTGGYICDKQFQNNFPIFKIALPVMALMIAYAMNNILNNEGEEED
jgi:hypothetical protein